LPLGIVNDDEFESEIKRDSNTPKVTIPSSDIKQAEVIDLPSKGRKEGDRQVPDSLRKIIGETSEVNGRQEALALAKSFGISPSSVSAYANGATSTASYNEEQKGLRDHINKAKERISKRARTKLILALNEITPEKLAAAKLGEVSAVARNMSGIVKDMEPAAAGPGVLNGPQFLIYSPQFSKEEHFETIVVKE